MDALMIVLVVTLLSQAGGRLSGFAERLAERTGRAMPVLAGVMLAQGILAVVAIRIGIMLGPQVTPETRTLLLAVALTLVGIGMMGRLPRPGSPFGSVHLGVFGIATLGAGWILLMESGLVLIAIAAARSPLPWAAWPGAMLGLAGALLPAILLGTREWRRLAWRAIRVVGGAALSLSGIIVVLSVKGLI
jgi:putative Ca2+/H+ antiporter (TMEM165/GDT1 family)